ncbi:unnamed protein product, partial [Closterium sp. NIES-64]
MLETGVAATLLEPHIVSPFHAVQSRLALSPSPQLLAQPQPWRRDEPPRCPPRHPLPPLAASPLVGSASGRLRSVAAGESRVIARSRTRSFARSSAGGTDQRSGGQNSEARLEGESWGGNHTERGGKAKAHAMEEYLRRFVDYEQQGVPNGAAAAADAAAKAGAGLAEGGARAGEQRRAGEERFDLQRMQRLMGALGSPVSQYKVVHVAGTKGKGSTVHFIASILRAAGLAVGTYTSPHVVRLNERIVGPTGQPASDAQLAALVARHGSTVDAVWHDEKRRGGVLSHFEFLTHDCPSPLHPPLPLTPQIAHACNSLRVPPVRVRWQVLTALAFTFFAQQRVQVAVVEVGLGGVCDATNVIPAGSLAAAVITGIGMDHVGALGGSLHSIVRAKAGIMHASTPVVIAPQPHPTVLPQLLSLAHRLHCPTVLVAAPHSSASSASSRQGSTVLRGAASSSTSAELPPPCAGQGRAGECSESRQGAHGAIGPAHAEGMTAEGGQWGDGSGAWAAQGGVQAGVEWWEKGVVMVAHSTEGEQEGRESESGGRRIVSVVDFAVDMAALSCQPHACKCCHHCIGPAPTCRPSSRAREQEQLRGVHVGMVGAHQAANAATAVGVALLLRHTLGAMGSAITPTAVRHGLLCAPLPGRFQVLRPAQVRSLRRTVLGGTGGGWVDGGEGKQGEEGRGGEGECGGGRGSEEREAEVVVVLDGGVPCPASPLLAASSITHMPPFSSLTSCSHTGDSAAALASTLLQVFGAPATDPELSAAGQASARECGDAGVGQGEAGVNGGATGRSSADVGVQYVFVVAMAADKQHHDFCSALFS